MLIYFNNGKHGITDAKYTRCGIQTTLNPKIGILEVVQMLNIAKIVLIKKSMRLQPPYYNIYFYVYFVAKNVCNTVYILVYTKTLVLISPKH